MISSHSKRAKQLISDVLRKHSHTSRNRKIARIIAKAMPGDLNDATNLLTSLSTSCDAELFDAFIGKGPEALHAKDLCWYRATMSGNLVLAKHLVSEYKVNVSTHLSLLVSAVVFDLESPQYVLETGAGKITKSELGEALKTALNSRTSLKSVVELIKAGATLPKEVPVDTKRSAKTLLKYVKKLQEIGATAVESAEFSREKKIQKILDSKLEFALTDYRALYETLQNAVLPTNLSKQC